MDVDLHKSYEVNLDEKDGAEKTEVTQKEEAIDRKAKETSENVVNE